MEHTEYGYGSIPNSAFFPNPSQNYNLPIPSILAINTIALMVINHKQSGNSLAPSQVRKHAAKPSQLRLFDASNHSETALASLGLTKTGAPIREHGGKTRQGKRKIARPFCPKRTLHVVLRASKARGERSLLQADHKKWIDTLLRRLKARYGVKIHRFANVGNHVHLLVQAGRREDFQGFLRQFAGMIAFRVSGAKKGKKKGRFWDHLAWSRVVEWGREFKALGTYLVKNALEGAGLFRGKHGKGWTMVIPNTEYDSTAVWDDG